MPSGPWLSKRMSKSDIRTVKSISIWGGEPMTWRIPTRAEAMAQSSATWGKQYDRVERKMVEGGLPIVIERMAS